MSETFVEVVLDRSLARPLDYAVPAHLLLHVKVGARVEVPLKNVLKQGTISAIKHSSEFLKVRPIARLLLPEATLSPALWKLADWMSHYYAAPLQKVLKCFFPPNVRKGVKQKQLQRIALAVPKEEALLHVVKNGPQTKLIEALAAAKEPLPLAELLTTLQISRSPVETLAKKKIVLIEAVPIADLSEEEFFQTRPKSLNKEQEECLAKIISSLESKQFASHLIHGVTGSGKTEVYMQAIQAALEQNRSAILLVPEIALTSQTIERLRARFQQKIAVLHHKKSLGERTAAWDDLLKNEAQIVVGARSAIFAPAQNLGLIIIDEEHDGSYKQSDEAPCYHGRDVAVMRAHLEKAVVVLGSATPSLESYANAKKGKYILSTLSSRATSAPMPKVQIVDMKTACDKAGGFTHFSEELIEALRQRVEVGEQALLFLNRRGYRRQQMCGGCRHVLKCPHCDLALTYHLSSNILSCHLCNYQRETPRECPSCRSSESLEFKGFGTEHVERSLHALFPSIRTLRMDRDTTQQKNSHEELFMQFRAHKADVLIGTQMIAKGFHFPSATLVGVLNADTALNIPDFRSGEQVFQLLTQVAGRAGRSELPGEVIIQTYIPDHPILALAAAQDYNSFYASEIEERKLFSYPPFCRLIKILFSGEDAAATERLAQSTCSKIQELKPEGAEILPVLPSGHPKIKDLYRFQFIIKSINPRVLESIFPSIPASTPEILVKIDVDPLNTFF
ncbi:MAG: primosomal protein N' [Verrucomicrobia bacterium]|nr:primosomal protein N' [Verrucomicrobiota bacterium]